MLDVAYTNAFKRDIKRLQKRGYDARLLDAVVFMLRNGEQLPEKNKDHELSGRMAGLRECHITPGWLLVYEIDNGILTLTLSRTGTHSDLF